MALRALVVEDNSSIRRPVVKRLQKQGFIVTEADDGVGAVKLFKDGHYFPLVLMDNELTPYMDGPTATSEIRRILNGAKCMIVGISMKFYHEKKIAKYVGEEGYSFCIKKALDNEGVDRIMKELPNYLS